MVTKTHLMKRVKFVRYDQSSIFTKTNYWDKQIALRYNLSTWVDISLKVNSKDKVCC